jgi:DNA repair protein RadA/Sms
MPPKSKTIFVCQNCGAETAKWQGKCNSCNEWNTIVEELVSVSKESAKTGNYNAAKYMKPLAVGDITITHRPRIDTHSVELNRTLGGGLVPGSVVLIGGEPGIGKSTLALQVALQLQTLTTLYISGEESAEQIRLRADRIGKVNANCLILSETNLDNILACLDAEKPQMVVIDSIQTLQAEYIESVPGSVSQIRECSNRLVRFAKNTSTPVVLIGHIVKDGSLAGPKVLEHIVDSVLQFEGDGHYMYRILRATKNRFGSTSEIGIFEMQASGLQEVANPSEMLISHNEDNMSGIAISAAVSGNRPYLIEVQALVSSAVYGTPQRSTTGFDMRRLNMLLAVLEKRAGFKLGVKDVFLNIAGGIKVDDPAIDLAVVSAILSSNADLAIPSQVCVAGEISLSGEIRPVQRVDQRIAEAEKLGFKKIIVSKFNHKSLDFSRFNIEICQISRIEQLPKVLFG